MGKVWEDMLFPEGNIEYPDAHAWKQWRSKITTGVGGLSRGFRSEMVLRGYQMIEEMTGKVSFIQGLVLSLTGRLPSNKEDRLLNSMFINTALADPRFWLFRVARLGATVKSSPAACVSAGILTNEAEIFSSGAAYNTSTFFQDVLTELSSKKTTLEKIIKTKLYNREIISGFGRVLARGPDERNPTLLKVAKECELDQGEHLKLAFEIEALIQEHKNPNIYMNSGGLKCAILLDMGFSPHQIMIFYSLMLIIGMAGNVAEAYERPPGEFLPLSNDDIEYIGLPLRKLPPASEKQTIVLQTEKGRIVAMDSVSFLETSNRGDIIVCGSHGGIPAAEHCMPYRPKAVFFNDAGKGKDAAGVKGLDVLASVAVPAAAVAAGSAKIGDGMDTYTNGVVSALNDHAYTSGVREGMPAKEASLQFLR